MTFQVGIQLEENERGMGVIGIVEADFLQPTHNKQAGTLYALNWLCKTGRCGHRC